jgi:hypothetical protein
MLESFVDREGLPFGTQVLDLGCQRKHLIRRRPFALFLIHNPDADFVEVNQQVGRILVHAIGA